MAFPVVTCADQKYSQVTFLRKSHGSRLNVFSPVNDLSALSKTGAADRALLPGQQGDLTIAGGQILGDEYSDHVVKVGVVDQATVTDNTNTTPQNRSGIILREGYIIHDTTRPPILTTASSLGHF